MCGYKGGSTVVQIQCRAARRIRFHCRDRFLVILTENVITDTDSPLDPNEFVLFKVQLGEPFLGILILFFSSFFRFYILSLLFWKTGT